MTSHPAVPDDLDTEESVQEQARQIGLALEQSHGQPVDVPFDATDVGGQLVSIVSSGLYPDPRDAIREYCQNAVDAGAGKIDITLRGFNVEVEDDGSGMVLADLIRARRFGMSQKNPNWNIGFRGIGVYAGFPICDSVHVVTQTAESTVRYTLRFDFKWMREVIRDQTQSGNISLAYLMRHGTQISFETTAKASKGKTVVHLENLNSSAYHDLSDWTALEQYIVATLPVGYDPEFDKTDAIEENLRKRLPDFRTVTINVENEDSGDKGTMVRRFPDDPKLTEIEFWDVIDKKSKERLAVAWASWGRNKKIEHDAAGLLFKVKGFTIGDRHLARRFFSRPALYDWFVGEIHVVDPELVPNAARSDFEANSAKRRLDDAIGEQVAKKLDGIASRLSRIETAKKRFEAAEDFLKSVRERGSQQTREALEAMRAQGFEHIRIIENRRLTDPELADLEKRRPGLVKDLKTAIDQIDDDLRGEASSTRAAETREGTGETRAAVAATAEGEAEQSATEARGTLATSFQRAGWSLSPSFLRGVKIVDEALLEVVKDRTLRSKIMAAVSRRLKR